MQTDPSLSTPPILCNPPSSRPSTALKALVSVFAFIFLLGLLFLGLTVYAITSYVRLGSDERALRNSLLKASSADWHTKGEVNVGPCTVTAARIGLAFAHLKPEARTAVSCVRAGQFGMYETSGYSGDRVAMLSAADKVMERRGWDRVVGVINDENLVAVYIGRDSSDDLDLKVCVAVIDEGRLILASARGDLEPLMKFANEHPEWRSKAGLRRLDMGPSPFSIGTD